MSTLFAASPGERFSSDSKAWNYHHDCCRYLLHHSHHNLDSSQAEFCDLGGRLFLFSQLALDVFQPLAPHVAPVLALLKVKGHWSPFLAFLFQDYLVRMASVVGNDISSIYKV